MAKKNSVKKSVVESIEFLKGILEEAALEAVKFEEKEVNAAGVRVRNALKELRDKAQLIRKMVTVIKNDRKATRKAEKEKPAKKKTKK